MEKLRRLLAVMADPRMPKLPRLAVLAAVAYVIWPVDLVPDFAIPAVGYLDDLVVLWMSLRWLLKPLSSEDDLATEDDLANPPTRPVDGVIDIPARPVSRPSGDDDAKRGE